MGDRQGSSRLAKIVAIANQKGGVGKTTTAVNLAACLGLAGRRTLLVDLDPQGNASSGVGFVDRDAVDSVYEGLVGKQTIERLILRTETDNLFLVPSITSLAGAEIELVGEPDRAFKLRKLLEPVLDLFDFVIVDCPPSLGILTLNALSAADSLIVPIQAEYYALEGVGRLLSTVELVKDNLNPNLQIEGFLLTMFDTRNKLSHHVAREVNTHFGDITFRSVIPRNVRLSESPSHGKPIVLYDRMCRGAHSYLDLTDEFLRGNTGRIAA